MERDLRHQLGNKLGLLPTRVMEHLVLRERMANKLIQENSAYLKILHRNCPDNRPKHHGRGWGLECCIACYTDEQGAEHHCSVEIEVAELIAGDYVGDLLSHQIASADATRAGGLE